MKANKFLAVALAALTLVGFNACKKENKADGLTLNPTSMTLKVGEKGTITATVGATWTTNNEAIATVAPGNDGGKTALVTAVAEGTAIISATANGETKTCVVRVQNGGGQGGGEQGGGGETAGEGSYSQPYNVAAVIANGTSNTKTGVYVKGYIVGWVSGQVLASGAAFNSECTVKTNILIADKASETDVNNCVPVQLPNNAVRTGLNLQDHPEFYGKEVILYGNLEKYFGAAGIKSVTYAESNGQQIGTKP